MKKVKVAFWISTIIIFLFEGVMPALTGHTEMAKEGVRHLGYPDYFGTLLTISKVIGATLLMLPIPPRLKEWAYAGLTFDFSFAFASHWAVGGLQAATFFPLVVLAILAVSYFSYHRLLKRKVLMAAGPVN